MAKGNKNESFFDDYGIAPAAELLPLQCVDSVRTIAMAHVRQQARRVTVSPEPRAHRFVLFDNSGGEIGSDLTDVFLGVSVMRSGYREHSMRISFLELLLSEANRYSNYREVYMFDWQEGERVFARKRTIENIGRIIATSIEVDGQIIDTVGQSTVETLSLLEPSDCEDLCDRMLAVANNIKRDVA